MDKKGRGVKMGQNGVSLIKKYFFKIILGGFFLFAYSFYSYAAELPILRLDSNISHNGGLVNGKKDLKVEILSQDQKSVLWTQEFKAVEFIDGSFSVNLGSNEASVLRSNYFSAPNTLIRIQMESDTALIPVNYVPKSFFSLESTTANVALSVDWSAIKNNPVAVINQEGQQKWGINVVPSASLDVSGNVIFRSLPFLTEPTFSIIALNSTLNIQRVATLGQSGKFLRVKPDESGFELSAVVPGSGSSLSGLGQYLKLAYFDSSNSVADTTLTWNLEKKSLNPFNTEGLVVNGVVTTNYLMVNNDVTVNGGVTVNGDMRVEGKFKGDGSLLSNVNATQLQGSAVSNTAPSKEGQVLKWNNTNQNWEPGAPILSGIGGSFPGRYQLPYFESSSSLVSSSKLTINQDFTQKLVMYIEGDVSSNGVVTANQFAVEVSSYINPDSLPSYQYAPLFLNKYGVFTSTIYPTIQLTEVGSTDRFFKLNPDLANIKNIDLNNAINSKVSVPTLINGNLLTSNEMNGDLLGSGVTRGNQNYLKNTFTVNRGELRITEMETYQGVSYDMQDPTAVSYLDPLLNGKISLGDQANTNSLRFDSFISKKASRSGTGALSKVDYNILEINSSHKILLNANYSNDKTKSSNLITGIDAFAEVINLSATQSVTVNALQGIALNSARITLNASQSITLNAVETVALKASYVTIDATQKVLIRAAGVSKVAEANPTPATEYGIVFENPSSDFHSGVLQLKLGGQSVKSSQSFIGFSNQNDEIVGSISGHSSTVMGVAQSGVKLESAGADYAEYLPQLDEKEEIAPGSIVGVFAGKITKATLGADKVMVVSTMPIVLGNAIQNKKTSKPVAFVGQVPVKVRGVVNSGDYILPSSFQDGTGIAVSKALLSADQAPLVIGQAWSQKTDSGISDVNVALTTGSLSVYSTLYEKQKQLELENKALKALLEQLSKEVQSLKK